MKKVQKSNNNKEVKKSVNRWNELIELSQLKEREYADEYDTYYNDSYYDLIADYTNEFIDGGDY